MFDHRSSALDMFQFADDTTTTGQPVHVRPGRTDIRCANEPNLCTRQNCKRCLLLAMSERGVE